MSDTFTLLESIKVGDETFDYDVQYHKGASEDGPVKHRRIIWLHDDHSHGEWILGAPNAVRDERADFLIWFDNENGSLRSMEALARRIIKLEEESDV